MLFPNFLIIGANKGGTSSFYVYLNQHPEIFMSKIKEPMFFLYNGKVGNKIENSHPKEPKWKDWRPITDEFEYKKMFVTPPGIKAAGEASTAYLANPECAERIYKFNPEMKIIVLLRDPVSRAFSNYLMYVRMGHESKRFEKVVREELEGKRNYLPQGRHYLKLSYYHDSLLTYINRFGREKIKVYLIEELKEKPEWLFNDVFKFLDVDPFFLPDVSKKHNVNGNVAYSSLSKIILDKVNNYLFISNLIPSSIKNSINKNIKLDKELKTKLLDLYKGDILKVESLIGKDLSSWL